MVKMTRHERLAAFGYHARCIDCLTVHAEDLDETESAIAQIIARMIALLEMETEDGEAAQQDVSAA